MSKKKRKKPITDVTVEDDESSGHELVPAEQSSPFRRYLWEANKYPLLTLEEEQVLTRQYYKTHDQELGRRLVLSNLRLVVKIAMEYYYKVFCNLTDLVQEGNLGLVMAVQKFDPAKGIRFPSYAQFWIRAYMLKYLLNTYSMVKVGTTRRQKKVFYNLNKAREAIEQLGIKAEPKLLAEYLNVKDKDIMIVDSRMQNRDVSLDAPAGEEGKQTLQDTIIMEPRFEKEVESRDMESRVKDKLAEFQATLNEKEKYIWECRLLAENKMTLEELAVQFHISKERVRQLEERMIKNLKKFWEKNAAGLSISDILSAGT
jgi:RNA polymerase sigma-32 factor